MSDYTQNDFCRQTQFKKSSKCRYMTHIVRGVVAGSLSPQLKDEMLDELW